MDLLKDFLKKSKERKLRIAVVGDSMVDKYYRVRVKRISPEFPIKVMWSKWDDVNKVDILPGGAGNVAMQMRDWNVDVFLLSVLGNRSLFDGFGFDVSLCETVPDWKNPEKNRFYDGDFPVERLDHEDPVENTLNEDWEIARRKIKSNLESLKLDVVILSDYGKGVFADNKLSVDIIDHCRENGIITVVDPKCLNCRMWAGCNIFKPNVEYVKNFCDKYDELTVKDVVNCDSVIVTDAGNGVTVDGKFYTFSELSNRRPVIRSVIGGGDCYVSFLAMAFAIGFNVKDSARIAFNASSCYIEDRYNNPVSRYRFASWADPVEAKVIGLEELLALRDGGRWVFTNGCFDFGLTRGHIECLIRAKSRGDKLIVALNSDESVRRLKGDGRPVMPLEDRMKIVASLSFVDFVISFDEKTPIKLIEKIVPALICKGGDYKEVDVAGYGICPVEIIPLVESVSTTEKIKKRRK